MPADQPRNRTVGCKMTDSEYEKLAAVAEQDGQTLGEWCREVILRGGQTWNRYAYVGGMPLSYIDPLGLVTCGDEGPGAGTCVDVVASMPPDVGTILSNLPGGLGSGLSGLTGVPPGGPIVGNASGGGGGNRAPSATKAASNTTNCSHGFGIGVQGGGTAAAGLKSGGVVTGQLGGGLFVNPSGPSVGAYTSGALAGRWGSSTGGYPSQSLQAPWVGGAYAGYGPGIFITNAGSPAQLGGPFAVLNIDIGIGIGKASMALAADKSGTVMLTINGGPFPYAGGLGFDVSGFTSNTKIVGTGCKP